MLGSKTTVTEVDFHQCFVGLGHGLDEMFVQCGNFIVQVCGDLALFGLAIDVGNQLHIDEIDYLVETFARIQRMLDGDGLAAEAVLDLQQQIGQIGVGTIHLVDKEHAWQVEVAGIAPDPLRAHIDAGGAVDDDDAAIGNT